MKTGDCYIFGAGEYFTETPKPGPDDFIIAADGGFSYLQSHNMVADLVIGDFDSLHDLPPAANVVPLPQEKDQTDMLAALQEGWSRGYRTFHICGGTGGRFDHTMANIQCLAYLTTLGAQGFLYDKTSVITAIRDGSVSFSAESRGTLSVFALSETAEGVDETGLRYTLNHATLRHIYPLGVSNEFIGVESRLSVKKGTLLVIYPQHIAAVFEKISQSDLL